MKCECLIINRGRAERAKGKYESLTGSYKTGIFGKTINYYIPDNAKPIEIVKGKRTIPLWIVNAKTGVALTLTSGIIKDKLIDTIDTICLNEITDADVHTKLNLLTKRSFWEMVAEKLQIGIFTTILYLGAGYGLFRFAEYFLVLVFKK